jgi:hypothetical protein
MKTLSIAAVVAGLTIAGSANSAELVSNGGFESGMSAWTVGGSVFAGTGAIYGPCCSTSGSEPNYSSNHFGSFGAGNVAGPHSLTQMLATVIGATYVVNFDAGALGGGNQTIQLLAMGDYAGGMFNSLVNNNLDFTFTHHSLSFVANSTSTALTFLVNTPGPDNVDTILDNVSVSGAVPEPATWAMMLMGFGLIGATLRGSRRAAVEA